MKYEDIKITVQWEDICADKSRPHTTVFKPYDFVDECYWNQATDKEKEAVIDDAVLEEFAKEVYFSINEVSYE